ncbi:MAG TPA: hypothetical protein VLC92_01155 [Rhodocyclaceae bacterium]|nr:hypothetical protein [Rhodocyclaceae bacterium]
MTLPRLASLTQQWKRLPPVPLQLLRLSYFLGVKPPSEAESTPLKTVQDASSLGVPVMSELPDDPMLKFLDE